jgi:hypothetical protein
MPSRGGNYRPRVLVLSTTPLWPRSNAITLEVALRWWASGMDVTLMSCDGALESCPANPLHDLDLCRRCVLQTQRTEEQLLPDEIKTRRLGLLEGTHRFEQPRERVELLETQYRGVPIGRFVASQLATNARDGEFALDSHTGPEARRLMQFAARLYDSAEALFRREHFDIVCVRNGRRPAEGPIAWAAHQADAWTLTFDDLPQLGRFNLSDSLSVHDRVSATVTRRRQALDLLLKPAGWQRALSKSADFYCGQREGGRRSRQRVHFASEFDDTFQVPTTQKPIMLVAPSSQWEFLHVQDVHENQYDTLAALLEQEDVIASYDVIVRWHPNLKNAGPYEAERIRQLIRSTDGRVVHYDPDSSANTYTILDAANVVVTFGSTVSAEAAAIGKPTFVFGSSALTFGSSVHAINSVSDLVAALNSGRPSPRSPFYAHVLGATWSSSGMRAIFVQPVKRNRWMIRSGPRRPWSWIELRSDRDRKQRALRQLARITPRWVFRLVGR